MAALLFPRFRHFPLFRHSGRPWMWLGLRLLAALAVCALAGWGVRGVFFARQLDQLAQESRRHLEFYRLSLDSLLSRNESLPRILAMEKRLEELLRDPSDRARLDAANAYLREVKNRAGLDAVFLTDKDGLTLAASNAGLPGSYVGNNYDFRPYFQEAMKGRLGIFYGVGTTTGEPGYFLAAPIKEGNGEALGGEPIGVVVVKIKLEDFEEALARNGNPILLADANGVVFLASLPELKYHSLTPLPAEVLARIGASRQYGAQPLRPLGMELRVRDEPQYLRIDLRGRPAEAYLAQSAPAGRLGWSILVLSRTRQERQSALLAGAAASLALAFLLSLAIFFRLNARRYRERRRADAALRQAHASLEARIAERTADLTATKVSLEEKVAALKTTESILRETRDTAVQAGKLAVLGQMAAGISHEINQPLTALHTFADNAAELLELGKLDEVRENLGLIRQMAVRMGHIVGEIKSFTRRPSPERQAVDVAGVVYQALMLVETQRKRSEARIDARGVADGLRAWADAQRLEQVLVNLLLNAIDAVRESAERRISLSAERRGEEVRIVVRDSGPGIPRAALPRLFEPFFTTKPAGQGIGLGLAISRMIASELGGRLDARNHQEGGAEFTVTLEGA
ncbi:MAG: GHKL domain-containing protein [Candidatus Accumulibacter sp.]|jgi:two-component system C4-dicarboxylate transport sensor histidine kinase DctB|nr:GHKL domain-containing protein [Accumulibacter sp.]